MSVTEEDTEVKEGQVFLRPPSDLDHSDLTPSSCLAPFPLANFPRATHLYFLSSRGQLGSGLRAGDKVTAPGTTGSNLNLAIPSTCSSGANVSMTQMGSVRPRIAGSGSC